MNQGKLEVVKQEMARVNIDILGISERKWTGMGEFNSYDQYIYYCGQESLRRNGVAIMVNKSPKCSTWMQSQKRQNDLCSFPRQTIQHHSNPSLCPNQQRWSSWSWTVLWRPTRTFRTNTQKRRPFHYRGLECKVGSQEIPGVTGKFGLGVQNKAGQRIIEFCQENALVIANTLSQRHKRRLYTRTSPDGQHQNQIDYILCSQRWRSSIQSAKTRPGADCGSDHELLIAKFRLKLKKVGKTTRPFGYDLNHIPYDYIVEVRNRLKGLDLIEYLKI